MKKISLLVIFCLLALVLVACNNSTKEINENAFQKYNDYKVTLTGGLDSQFIYHDVEHLSAVSDLIITAEVVSPGNKTDHTFSDGDVSSYTRTTVKITETHKGDFKKGDTLEVAESAYFDEERQVYISDNGYNLMREGTKYLLFLKKYDESRGYQDSGYMTTGIYLGKYDLEKNNPVELLKEATKFQEIRDKEYVGYQIEKFNQFKKEAIKKYID